MARRGGLLATLNGVRYLLFAFGLLLVVGSCQKTEGRTSDDLLAFAWFCVVVGFPFPLLVLPFRFVARLLRLFGIGKRNPVSQPSAPVASSRQFKPYDEATVCFVVGKAYRCRDRGYGETAHRIIRRQRGRVQMTCDVIQYCSDYRPWRTITIVDGVETLEKGKIRADDEYLGPQNFTQSYIDAARGET